MMAGGAQSALAASFRSVTRSSPRMEPRPPRPRSPRPFETPASPETAGIGERLYPVGETTYHPSASEEPYAPGVSAEPPLLPRRQRRQRGALRGIAVAVVAIAAIAALGWVFRDAVRGFISPPPPTPTSVAQVQEPAGATPGADAESAALPNALSTVTPTAGPAATATPRPEETSAPDVTAEVEDPDAPAEPDRDISAQTLPLLDLLPTQAQVPAGLILADEAERSKADVVASLGGTEEASQLLDDWGWSGNAYRDFIADPDATTPSVTGFLNVSIHRFADAESAANAMIFFSDQVIILQELQEVEPPAIGESARLLLGSPDGLPIAVLYAQQGPIMYRIGGSTNSADGDPSADVLAVAAEIIPGQSTEG
jgi:hypothetical protein